MNAKVASGAARERERERERERGKSERDHFLQSMICT